MPDLPTQDHQTQEPLLTYDPQPGTAADRLTDNHAAGSTGPGGPPAAGLATGFPAVPGFDLLAEVGRGGMGVVYSARDRAFGRDVAVKLLQDQFPADGTAAHRFLEEARITGCLQHPGVPAAYQTGALPDGRPYLAMKLIRGDTLDEMVRQDGADRGRHLAAFEGVCQAVAFAHAHGVVHRDLKPTNVMVGAFGEVQVMDWGLAKVLRDRRREAAEPASDATADLPARSEDEQTQTGIVLGTPAYMPPEQAAGRVDEVDERSDVFGLGAVLCSILTGQPPYTGSSAGDTRKRAAQGQLGDAFARLDSCGAEPQMVDLCKSCLAADKMDRPANGGAVAAAVAGLRAAAEDRARQAERDRHEAEVRAAEQARRRRVVQWAAGAVAAVLLLGIAGTAVGLFRADRARQDAVTQGGKAADARDKALDALDTATSEFIGDTLLRQPPVNPEQKKFLTRLVGLYRDLAAEQGDDAGARRRVADALHRVGIIEQRLGRTTESEAVLRQAREEYVRLIADFPDRPEYRRKLGQVINSLSGNLFPAGRVTELETELRVGLKIWDALVAEFPTDPEYQWGRGRTWMRLGNALTELGRRADSVAAFRSADVDFARLTAEIPGEPKYQQDQAVNRANLAFALIQYGKAEEAEAEAGKAVAQLEPLADAIPFEPNYRLWLAISWTQRGAAQSTLGRSDDAEAAFRSAVKVLERLVADFPANPDHRRRLIDAHGELGRMLALTGKPAAAEAPFRASAEAAERLAADYPSVPLYKNRLALSRGNYGQVLLDLKRPAEAEPFLRAAVATHEGLLASDPNSVPFRTGLVYGRDALGLCNKALGRHAEAETVYRAALADAERVAAARPGESQYPVLVAGILGNIGELNADTARLDDALTWFDRSAAALGPEFAKSPKEPTVRLYLRNAHQNRAIVLSKLGRHPEAETAWERAFELTQSDGLLLLRTARAVTRARAGRTSDVIKEVGELAADPACDAEGLYNLACAVARSAAADLAHRDEYAGRAIELLKRAKDKGYTDLDRMAADQDLAALRNRTDFQAQVKKPEVAPPPRLAPGGR